MTGAREAAADRLRSHPGRTRVPKMTDKATHSPEDLAEAAAAQLAEIRSGYAFEGPALLFGAAVLGVRPPVAHVLEDHG